MTGPARTPYVPGIEEAISAYLNGYYPMAQGKDGGVGFYYYEPRGIIPLDNRFTVRKSLRQALGKAAFEIRIDTAFDAVIRNCARHDVLPDGEIWISEGMIRLYNELSDRGIAHSVETWHDGELVGGLYGLAFGSAFCGESMFSKEPYASQAALVGLVEHLRKQRFTLLDAQMVTEHLQQFGLITISQKKYLELFREALSHSEVSF